MNIDVYRQVVEGLLDILKSTISFPDLKRKFRVPL